MSVPLDTRNAIHIARQPILDANCQVFGYELLYRESARDASCTADGDLAGSRVLTDALLGIGLETLTTRVWGSFDEGFLAQAGLSSIALVLASGVLTWGLILRRAQHLA